MIQLRETKAFTIIELLVVVSIITLLIGDQTPLGSAYFVQVDGGDIVTVDAFYIAALQNLLDVPPIIQPAP